MSRAIHLETANSLESDSFVNALHRFIAIRGLVRQLMCARELNLKSLRTLLSEVMCIANSRPLSVNNLYDPSTMEPLTPNHILTVKTKIVLPPTGELQLADVYSRKRWRRVQYTVC